MQDSDSTEPPPPPPQTTSRPPDKRDTVWPPLPLLGRSGIEQSLEAGRGKISTLRAALLLPPTTTCVVLVVVVVVVVAEVVVVVVVVDVVGVVIAVPRPEKVTTIFNVFFKFLIQRF